MHTILSAAVDPTAAYRCARGERQRAVIDGRARLEQLPPRAQRALISRLRAAGLHTGSWGGVLHVCSSDAELADAIVLGAVEMLRTAPIASSCWGARRVREECVERVAQTAGLSREDASRLLDTREREASDDDAIVAPLRADVEPTGSTRVDLDATTADVPARLVVRHGDFELEARPTRLRVARDGRGGWQGSRRQPDFAAALDDVCGNLRHVLGRTFSAGLDGDIRLEAEHAASRLADRAAHELDILDEGWGGAPAERRRAEPRFVDGIVV